MDEERMKQQRLENEQVEKNREQLKKKIPDICNLVVNTTTIHGTVYGRYHSQQLRKRWLIPEPNEPVRDYVPTAFGTISTKTWTLAAWTPRGWNVVARESDGTSSTVKLAKGCSSSFPQLSWSVLFYFYTYLVLRDLSRWCFSRFFTTPNHWGAQLYNLPNQQCVQQIDSLLSSVATDAANLPKLLEDPAIDVELRSLQTKVDAYTKQMQWVWDLVDFSSSVQLCISALSDLLEHMDGYPSPLMGSSVFSYTSHLHLSPED